MNDLDAAAPISPLRQRLIDDMTMRRFSRETQRNYIRDVGRFATFLGRSPGTATAEDLKRFQVEQREAGVPVPTMTGDPHISTRPGGCKTRRADPADLLGCSYDRRAGGARLVRAAVASFQATKYAWTASSVISSYFGTFFSMAESSDRRDGLLLQRFFFGARSRLQERVSEVPLDDDQLTHLAENAMRLFDDARLLDQHGRHASAFALAVLALEELGKLILDRWLRIGEVKRVRGETAHERKQRAALALLMAKDMEERFGALAKGKPINERSKEEAAKAIVAGGVFQAHSAAASGAFEKAKHLSLYSDDWNDPAEMSADHFESSDVEPMLNIFRAVPPAIADHQTMLLGRGIYLSDVET